MIATPHPLPLSRGSLLPKQSWSENLRREKEKSLKSSHQNSLGFRDVFQNLNWLVVSIPLKNLKVSWDDDVLNRWKNKSNVPNHQPAVVC
jgi:hypothetical protein